MTERRPAAEPPPQAVMGQMLTGYWLAQSLSVAATLGLADLVKDGPRSGADLAQATGTHGPALYRLLRALASVGVFAEEKDGRFALTPLAACLRSGVPGSQRSLARMVGDEHYLAWADLLYSLRTGKPAFEHRFGKPVFDYLAANPTQAKIFDEAMTGVHGAETAAMADAYDFSVLGTVVDVGGGNGSVLIGLLGKNPSLAGVLFDRPDVVERARPNLKAAGVERRCTAVAGSFFETVPPGGDAYLLRHIIHDWYDEQARIILGNCRKAMGPRSRLLVVETVIPPGNDPCFAKFLDLNMLVIPGGQERTEAEYRALFASAGFRLTRTVPTRADVSVIEGEPA